MRNIILLVAAVSLAACATSNKKKNEAIANKLDNIRAQETADVAEDYNGGLRAVGDPICVGLYENYAAVVLLYQPEKKSLIKRIGKGALSVVGTTAKNATGPVGQAIAGPDNSNPISAAATLEQAKQAGLNQAYELKCPVQTLLDLSA